MDFSGFNVWEVIVAALSGFVLGGIWYGPAFGKRWQQLVGLSDEEIADSNPALVFGGAFLLCLVMAAMLSLFLEVVSAMGSGLVSGALFGGLIALVFVAPSFGVNYLFSRRPAGLYGIDIGYVVLQFVLMGAILGAWH
jgi:hypothetical protein